ncbi:DUF4118 domain-containing protein [Streptomyces sp. MUM 136J]|uniref:DUF4118 domain-containing protein n=1 Tax=Streptomyces sp. MUM 136J TaxID=2791992 RepID=UPI001F04021F|nr:DUF4118 domain-containing protein [Streptomyces sp. MUM 136J]MCH0572296.1 DUF4118 domain-containing protein [Streptomyces sp. MUM 136J]
MSTATGTRRPFRPPHRLWVAGPAARDRLALVAGPFAPCAVALALVPFRDPSLRTHAALFLVVTVVAVAMLGSRTAQVPTALAAAACFDVFHTRPYGSFGISAPADVETTLLLLAVGLMVSRFTARARRLEAGTATGAGYLARLHATAALVHTARPADTVVDHVCGELGELLGLVACRFEYGTLLGRPARLEADGAVTVGRRSWDLEARGWPGGEIELRVWGSGHYLGRFMLTPGTGPAPTLQARLVAVTLAAQTGAALEAAR